MENRCINVLITINSKHDGVFEVKLLGISFLLSFTGITAGSNLIPGLGRKFQVDTRESNLKLKPPTVFF